MDDEVLEVLKQIRDEVKETNSRLSVTNTRLESLEGRVDFLERRVSKGLENLSERVDRHAEQINSLSRRQSEGELRLSTEVLALADVTRQIRDLLSTKLDDHNAVVNHEERIRALEDRAK
jgi:methyl-accepting chemotaxis protein